MTAAPLQGATAVDGARVRKMRKARGLSRAELAVSASALSGERVSVETVANVEREDHDVTASNLRAICVALGVTADEVLR